MDVFVLFICVLLARFSSSTPTKHLQAADANILMGSLDKLVNNLPPGMKDMFYEQLKLSGGSENLHLAIMTQLEKFGGLTKLQEAAKMQMDAAQKMVEAFNAAKAQPGDESRFDQRAQPSEQTSFLSGIDLTDKDAVKRAMADIKNSLPPAVQDIVKTKLDNFDGTLPDLTNFGITKFPTTKEEAAEALRVLTENLPPETRATLEKFKHMQSAISGGWNQGARDL